MAYNIVFNITLASILYYLYTIGILATAYGNNILHILETIVVVFAVGLASVFLTKKNNFTIWCMNTLLGLGLIGTIYGIFIAFSGINSNSLEPSMVAPVISGILTGIGAAIWTTITALFFHIALGGNLILWSEFGRK
jgi:hypothetical protein